MAGTGFQSRSTNVKPQKAGFPKLRRCHGSASPSLANIHITSQCYQVVSVFGFFPASLGYSCFSCPLLPLIFAFYFSSFIPFHLSFRSYEFIFELVLSFFLLAVLGMLFVGNFMIRFFWLFCQLGHWTLSLPLAADFLLSGRSSDAYLLAMGMYCHGNVSI